MAHRLLILPQPMAMQKLSLVPKWRPPICGRRSSSQRSSKVPTPRSSGVRWPDYSINVREAEKRILPLAADVKAGVLTALPFGHGRLFRGVRGQAIPDWARGFAGSWAQFFLKYLLGDPRVTAVIPGTGDQKHMTGNLSAMRGRLPDAKERAKMISFIEAL